MKNQNLPNLNRRNLIKSAAAAGAGLTLVPNLKAQGSDPHFFLNVVIAGGLDASLMWDARPLDMTDKGKIHNYLYKNDKSGAEVLQDASPIKVTGSNGTSALCSAIMEPLIKYQENFSIINGVCMLLNGMNGHGNNMYYLYTNSGSSGQESWMPRIGQQSKLPLDSVHIGGWDGDGNGAPSNFSGSVQLRNGQGSGLGNFLKDGPVVGLNDPLMQHISKRLQFNSQGNGLFSAGAKKMLSGLNRVPDLAETLKNISSLQTSSEVFQNQVNTALAYIKGGVASALTVQYDLDPIADTHSASGAQNQLDLYRGIVKNLDFLFKSLMETPYDEAAGLSILDVTSVIVTTEFSRTMIDKGSEPGNTGTQHNPLTNSAIMFGKGIQGGQVIGASDMSVLDGSNNFIDKSKAHDIKDPDGVMIMGKPFDFNTFKPRTDLPTELKDSDYLTFASVANTIMTLMGVNTEDQFRVQGVQAPVITQLLK